MMDVKAKRQTNRQTHKQISIQTDRHTDIQAEINRQTDRQTDRQTIPEDELTPLRSSNTLMTISGMHSSKTGITAILASVFEKFTPPSSPPHSTSVGAMGITSKEGASGGEYSVRIFVSKNLIV